MRKRQDRHSQRECKKWEQQIPPETRHVVAMDATQHVTYVGCLEFAFRRRTGRGPDATWTSGGETEAEKTRNRRAGGRCANRGGAWPRQQKPLGAFVTGRCRPEQEVAGGVPHGPAAARGWRRQAAHRCGRERGVSPLVETGDIIICGAAIFGMLVLKLLKQN